MIVTVMSHGGDEGMAIDVVDLARRCSGAHEVRHHHRLVDGTVDGLPGARIRSRVWPGVCTEVFQAVVASMPDGALMLNLEPDAVLTSPGALDAIEARARETLARWPDVVVMGHWKAPGVTPNALVEHMSGCSVYVCSPRLKEAVASCIPLKSWDLELFFRDILRPGDGVDVPEIRCLWGVPILPRKVLADYPSAALIHGDKTGALLRHVRRRVFGLPD